VLGPHAFCDGSAYEEHVSPKPPSLFCTLRSQAAPRAHQLSAPMPSASAARSTPLVPYK
jgi:hypothetical protein